MKNAKIELSLQEIFRNLNPWAHVIQLIENFCQIIENCCKIMLLCDLRKTSRVMSAGQNQINIVQTGAYFRKNIYLIL